MFFRNNLWTICLPRVFRLCTNYTSTVRDRKTVSFHAVIVRMGSKTGSVTIEEALRFIKECLMAAGAQSRAAQQQADVMVEADMMGHPSHGLNRLFRYVNEIRTGSCQPNNTPKILNQTASTAWVDANNVLGATSSHFAVDIAMKKAKKTGVGWVTVKGANDFGMAGLWARKPIAHGLIGVACCNTAPLMAPTRSKQHALGTNPIAVSAPGADNEYFYLDMSTTVAAIGKIEMQRRKGEPLPRGWAQGPDGKETTDPIVAEKTQCLMPLGGSEINSGYKGYGLAGAVEVLCGISSGSNYGHKVRHWNNLGEGGPANLGQCFIAIDPSTFTEGFGERLTDMIRYWRSLEPTDPSKPVLVPGDMERQNKRESCRTGRVSYVRQQIEGSKNTAKRLNVKPMDVTMD